MAFTVDEIANINNWPSRTSSIRARCRRQNIGRHARGFPAVCRRFNGGNEYVSLAVKSGQGGGSLQGYNGDDQVSYYNPVGTKRVKWAWKEHHIDNKITMTELKTDGIDVIENGTDQTTREMSGREDICRRTCSTRRTKPSWRTTTSRWIR